MNLTKTHKEEYHLREPNRYFDSEGYVREKVSLKELARINPEGQVYVKLLNCDNCGNQWYGLEDFEGYETCSVCKNKGEYFKAE